MDILSHGLWALAISKGLNRKRKTKIKTLAGFWWGVFPDLFAFTPLFIYIFWQRVFGEVVPDFSRGPRSLSPDLRETPIFQSAEYLYQYSHSLVIFALVFLLVYGIKRYYKKQNIFPLALTGWAVHIISDIPTHAAEFYPTPFLWPLSNYKFLEGFSWGVPWFMVFNYGLLSIVYIYLWRTQSRVDKTTL